MLIVSLAGLRISMLQHPTHPWEEGCSFHMSLSSLLPGEEHFSYMARGETLNTRNHHSAQRVLHKSLQSCQVHPCSWCLLRGYGPLHRDTADASDVG